MHPEGEEWKYAERGKTMHAHREDGPSAAAEPCGALGRDARARVATPVRAQRLPEGTSTALHVALRRLAQRRRRLRGRGRRGSDRRDVDGCAALHQLRGERRAAAEVQVHEAGQHQVAAVALPPGMRSSVWGMAGASKGQDAERQDAAVRTERLCSGCKSEAVHLSNQPPASTAMLRKVSACLSEQVLGT